MFQLSPFITVILKKDNKVLLLKRVNNAKWYPGCFVFPGGKMDGNETVTLAACREIKEELGITLYPEKLKVVHVCHYKRKDGFEGLDFFLLAEAWSGELCNKEPKKHESIEWIDKDELPKDLIPLHTYALDKINSGSFYSEFGWQTKN
ncbi:NUDIX domain-containing protein [bacterium]|nr:NUDIX domain-containing protein [bacterium]